MHSTSYWKHSLDKHSTTSWEGIVFSLFLFFSPTPLPFSSTPPLSPFLSSFSPPPLPPRPSLPLLFSPSFFPFLLLYPLPSNPQHRIPNQIDIPVRRSQIFEDSYNVIMNVRDVELLKSRLYVKFEGEVGYDYGGLAR